MVVDANIDICLYIGCTVYQCDKDEQFTRTGPPL